MKGSLDGLESAALMQHGGGRSYTADADTPVSADDTSTAEDFSATQRRLEEENEFGDGSAPLLSQFHEDAIQQAGMGPFQRLLLFVAGLALAADTTELFVVAYVIPSAEVELCMSGDKKAWLAAISFLGMMIGALIWGTISDSVGRRRALLSALFVNAIFGLMTAFMPTYGIFMTTRLCSGIGIGGGIPIVFAYYCEFIGRTDRGRHLSWLLVFWAIGGVFTALMAWLIIPRTGLSVVLDEQHHFSSWRVFLVVCSIPSFAAVFGLYFMPESPRFLLEQGRDVEAMRVYKKIFKWNHAYNPKAEYQLTELELPSGTHKSFMNINENGSSRSFFTDITHSCKRFSKTFYILFSPLHIHTTVVLLIVWFTSAFGFYGLSVWFPEYIKLLQNQEYERNATLIVDDVQLNVTFSGNIDNRHYVNSIFNTVTFSHIVLNHVTFERCKIFDSTFTDVRSSRTIFKNSYIERNMFVDTDMYDYRFQNCTMAKNVFRALIPGCTLDFDYNIHYEDIFQQNLIGQITLIPGTVLASFFMDKLGRVKVMFISMTISAISSFFIWFLASKVGVIVFEAVFNFIFISGWNALDIATTEAYPTHIRTNKKILMCTSYIMYLYPTCFKL